MKYQEILTNEVITRDMINSVYKMMNALPNPDKILRKSGNSIEAYRDLLQDPHVWSCLQSRKSGLLSLRWLIESNGASAQVVHEIESMLSNLDIHKIAREALEAPLFGFQPMEIIWKITDSGRKMIVPADIKAKPQEWFFFNQDGQLCYRKSGEPKGVIPPPAKILNVQYEASYSNPYGQSLLAKCWWPVKLKNSDLKYWINFTEKYGMPVLIGQYTRGNTTDEAEKLIEALNNVHEDSVLVAPSDIKIEFKEAVRNSSSALYKDLIKFCNNEISKAILSQTLTTELEMGSYAASQTHFRVRREVILSDVRLVEGVMDKLIRHIVDFNFRKPYPKFRFIMEEDKIN